MNVKNKHCVRKLGFRTFQASRIRNIVAIIAIALTTILFTCVFTIAMSINSSYQEYTFRQLGGYNHGTFKEVNEEQIERITDHSDIREYGIRTFCGSIFQAPFKKVTAEVSYMDDNCTKWSYCTPTTGRIPEAENEIAMDTKALELLGIPAELGQEVVLPYVMGNLGGAGTPVTGTFTLVGFWDYDKMMSVHYINVSKDYVTKMQKESSSIFRTDMNVMLGNSFNIEGKLQKVDTDLGYQWEDTNADNCVRLGYNWAYSTSAISEETVGMLLAVGAFVILIIFTGYLIVYNIFRISVQNDTKFYGMLKTIGTTPRQLKRIIRWQALLLSGIGIPIGCFIGYAIGAFLVPSVIAISQFGATTTVSASPSIFAFTILFSLVTVLLSCNKPGRIVAKISPVEAVRYTENTTVKAKSKKSHKASLLYMAFANMGRSKSKTILVLLSLSLALVLFNSVITVINGFDEEKYISRFIVTDFVVGHPGYFQFKGLSPSYGISQDTINEIKANTESSVSGCAYGTNRFIPQIIVSEDVANTIAEQSFHGGNLQAGGFELQENGYYAVDTLLEGMDASLLHLLPIIEGSLEPLSNPENRSIALVVDHYEEGVTKLPLHVGDKVPMRYAKEVLTDEEGRYLGTGETTEPIEYTICALVELPFELGYRMANVTGMAAVMNPTIMQEDYYGGIHPMFYAFDIPSEEAEREAEAYMADMTKDDDSDVMYQSKGTMREEFQDFKSMFILLGGTLCFIVGFIGILNFFNSIFTGIVTRNRELAMLQSVGMTGKQLKKMLIYEGILYGLGTIVLSLIVGAILNPLLGSSAETLFWFFTYRFRITPILLATPLFLLMGAIIPIVIYHFTNKKSIVERLREVE